MVTNKTVMYTGGNESPSETKRDGVITDPARSHLSTKAHYLTDDNPKVNNQLINIRCHWDRRWTIKVHSNKSIALIIVAVNINVTVTIDTAVIGYRNDKEPN